MRGYIEKRMGAHGPRYRLRVELRLDPTTGERRQASRTFRTRREAEAELARWLDELERGVAVDVAAMTLGEYLDHWLETAVRHTTRPSTFESYRYLIDVHIRPALGGVPLRKLQPARVQAFYAAKLAGGRGDGKAGGLSPRTVRYLHAVLHMALAQAVKWQMLARNVAEAVEPPRPARRPPPVWDAADALAFLAAARDDGYAPAWEVALKTGLRRGELLGLRWGDVDLAGGVLRVRRSLVVVAGRVTVQEPKTASGRRTVALPASCVAALHEHRVVQARLRELVGPAWRDEGLVFCTPLGGPIHPRNFARRFTALAGRAGLPAIPFHGLRHTHATLLLAAGVHVKVASERLGHSAIGVTLDTYSHALPALQREAAERLDDLLGGG